MSDDISRSDEQDSMWLVSVADEEADELAEFFEEMRDA